MDGLAWHSGISNFKHISAVLGDLGVDRTNSADYLTIESCDKSAWEIASSCQDKILREAVQIYVDGILKRGKPFVAQNEYARKFLGVIQTIFDETSQCPLSKTQRIRAWRMHTVELGLTVSRRDVLPRRPSLESSASTFPVPSDYAFGLVPASPGHSYL